MADTTVQTRDGGKQTIAEEGVEQFRTRLRGPLVLPDDPAYDEVRALWNATIDRRPALIARCAGAADVVECVNFAREQDLLVSVRGGGHNIAGLATCDGGLMIDLSLMKGVWVDPSARIARAQPGCTLGDLDRETQLHGLAAVLGFISTTGIAGLTLGGGFGYLTRRFGYTCDTLRSMEAVTAEGHVVRAAQDENEDLFWGLRGGGGNFGVVTSFEYEVHPVGPEIVAGLIAWRGEEAAEVLEFYSKFTSEAPEELTAFLGLRIAPPAPWLPPEIHGKPIALVGICHSGPIERAEKDVAQLKGFGKPVADIVIRRPYTQQQSLLDATQPKGRRYYWKSEYLPGLVPEAQTTLAEHAGRIVSPHSAIFLFHLAGELNRAAEDHSPAGNRDAQFVLNIAGQWEQPADDDANISWARACWEAMRPFGTGGVYINFLTEEEGAERVRAAYGDAILERLGKVKVQYDPENLFRVNKNIIPAA